MKRILGVLVLSLAAHAAQGAKIGDVTITATPDSPITIDADYTMTDTQTVHAPWFGHKVQIANNSDQSVTILEFKYKIVDPLAQTPANENNLSPSMYNFTLACEASGSFQSINYSDFGMYAPGETSDIHLTYRGFLGSGCPVVADQTPLMYVDYLGVKGHHTFNVEMHVIGWYGTLQTPGDRFEKVVTFTTN